MGLLRDVVICELITDYNGNFKRRTMTLSENLEINSQTKKKSVLGTDQSFRTVSFTRERIRCTRDETLQDKPGLFTKRLPIPHGKIHCKR